MTSNIKRPWHKDHKEKQSNFRTFTNFSKNDVSQPIDQSFVHINGTATNLITNSRPINSNNNELSNQMVEDEHDCIVINNSRFYCTVKNKEKVLLGNSKTKTQSQGDNTFIAKETEFPVLKAGGNSNTGERKLSFEFRNSSFNRPVNELF